MDSIDPAFDCKHVYHILEIDYSLLKPCCQSVHIFHLTKEAFDNYDRIPKTDKANLRNFIAPAVDDLPQSRLFTYTADDNDG